MAINPVNEWSFENNGVDNFGGVTLSISGTYTTGGKDGVYCLNKSAIGFSSNITAIKTLIKSATARFSFSIWVKFDADNTFHAHSSREVSGQYAFDFVVSRTSVQIKFNEYGTNNIWSATGLPPASTGVWHNYICTYDYSLSLASRVVFYLDSVLVPFTSVSTTTLSAIKDFTFFFVGDDSSQSFKDKVAIYDVALSQIQVDSIYYGYSTVVITSIDPSTFISNGDLLTITGTNLVGASTTEITIDGVDYTANIVSTSATEITFTAPDLTLWTHDLVVIADGIESDAYEISYIPAPVIKHKWNFEKNTNDSVGPNHGTLTGSYASGGV